MDIQYYIELTLKTSDGMESIARFFVGDNRRRAYSIFKKLQGVTDIDEKNLIYIDFMEIKEGLPLSVDIITCTLDQLGENCKTITKELFKLKTLVVI